MLDERERVEDAGKILAGMPSFFGASQAHADEHRVVLHEELIDRLDGDARLELDAESRISCTSASATSAFSLVLGNAEGIQASGLSLRLENGHRVTVAPQIARAREARRPAPTIATVFRSASPARRA